MKYRSLKKVKYELLEGMGYKTSIRGVYIDTAYFTLAADGWLYGENRYAWDGPSGPTRDTPTNMRASLFHDMLCQMIEMGLLDKMYRKYADELLRTLMLEDQTLYADGLLKIHMPGKKVKKTKMKGMKRALYLGWGRFRANGYYVAVRGWSKWTRMWSKGKKAKA